MFKKNKDSWESNTAQWICPECPFIKCHKPKLPQEQAPKHKSSSDSAWARSVKLCVPCRPPAIEIFCFRSKTQHSPSYTWKKAGPGFIHTGVMASGTHYIPLQKRTIPALSWVITMKFIPVHALSFHSAFCHTFMSRLEREREGAGCERPKCVANCALTFTSDDNAS